MKRFIPFIVSVVFLCFLSSSQCSDGPDAGTIEVNEYSVNIPSEGGEFTFVCKNHSYWMVEKYLIVVGDTEQIEYPTNQTCDDVCTYSNEWLTVTIPADNKKQLKVEMKPYTEETSHGRGIEVEMKSEDGSHITLSATQYSSNVPSFD
ncbi:MAG: hypothetical protein HFJ91_00395 [Muribaculaceae bacterium]|nr:hypothetical protein [Muribaculaceae bacterium]